MRNYSKRKRPFIPGSYHVKMIEMCLRAPDESFAKMESGAALHRAVLINDMKAISFLLDRGADVNFRDEIGCTPLMEAVFGGHKSGVALLIMRGADVNLADQDGWTPLMEACSKGWFEIAGMLLFTGANAEAKNKTGATAGQLVAKGHLKLLKLFSESGKNEILASQSDPF